MFNRTRLQLTVRNAAVLSVILIALNMFVYITMRQMLIAQVDDSISKSRNNLVLGLPGQKAVRFQVAQTDRPLLELYWTEDERPVPSQVSRSFTLAQLDKLKPSLLGESARTVHVGEQYFRVVSMASPGATTALGSDGQAYEIVTQQLLSNVSAEIGMLQRLRLILLIGGFAGLLIAVAAGYYLANRALIPIRLSLERQQQFVSDASHELRTPLSVIQAHAELLLRHPDHTIEQDSKHVSTVLQETRRMTKLVSGLLTLARSDSNQQELDKRPIQFDRIVQDVVGKMQMLAEVKELILTSEIESPVPMVGDEERLHQLLVILLDNAIKYTPEGGLVKVSCRRLAHSVQLDVEDTGVGIDAEHLPRIFDRFYRADKARTRAEGGTGLGLAIAKWIVERHGGRIRLESKRNAGTRVSVSLPR